VTRLTRRQFLKLTGASTAGVLLFGAGRAPQQPTETMKRPQPSTQRGESVIVQRSYVLPDLCIGCGICEYQCPVEREAAIRVYRQ
jgi:ferredoxin